MKNLDTDLIASEFSALKGTLYFNAAYIGPHPKRTQAAILSMVERMANPAKFDYAWFEYPNQARQKLGSLLKLNPEQFSINSSTNEVVSFYASGCECRNGDRVALFKDEYPSDVLPWLFAKKAGRPFEIDFYPKDLLLDPDQLARQLHPKTRFLNLSRVAFQDGNRVDLVQIGKLMAEREIRFVVDVTQGLGGLNLTPEELANIDLAVCSSYKWLLSPYGQAFAYWSKRAVNETQPTHGNWLTQPNAPKDLTVYTTDSKPGARRFDRGQAANMLGIKGLEASLSLFQELGLDAIERHNLSLVEFFLENLNRSNYELITKSRLRSTIVCIKAKGADSEALQARLQDANIDVSVREGNVRISFHLYNTRAQVERLLEVL